MTRPLKGERAEAYDRLMPLLSIPEEKIINQKNINPSSFFDHSSSASQIWLEIGFGGGEHLASLTKKYPGINFVGAEHFINGISALCVHIQKLETENIRIFPDDAMLLVRALKDQCIERLYILNPDPWPKKRHNKRRIINQQNLDEFSRILKPDGLLLACTDVDELAEWMVTEASLHPDFIWQANSCNDWKNPPADWASTTRYAEKGKRAGRKMTYLIFKKLANSLVKHYITTIP